MTNLKVFIKAADLLRKENSMWSSSLTEIDNIGEVICYRDYGVYKKGRPTVTRSNFKLNGKVISAQNLSNLLAKEWGTT
jgi:hypothetical protein